MASSLTPTGVPSSGAGAQQPTTASIGGGNRILTKQPQRGFQIRKVLPNRSIEQERDLRDQLYHDIEAKTKACSNAVYDCSLPRIEGHEFCLKHILLDPKSPYKQCSYTYPRTSKRCQQPAPKRDVYTNLCFEHSRQTQLQLTRQKLGSFRAVETNETLLRDLAHRTQLLAAGRPAPGNKYVDPYGPSARVLNYASDDSDGGADGQEQQRGGDANGDGCHAGEGDIDVLDATELQQMGGAGASWTNNADMDLSDNESVDSQNEDFLKHAGIYTTEEATVITKSKMIRLQTLYSEQILRLNHLLRQKRRQCLRLVERDSQANTSGEYPTAGAGTSALMGGSAQPSHLQPNGSIAVADIVQPRKTLKQKALNQYLKKHGVEAVLQFKAAERRAAAKAQQQPLVGLPSLSANSSASASAAAVLAGSAGSTPAPQAPQVRCIFSEGGVKCGERGLPLTKHCRRHILEDRAQVLFKACGIEKSGVVCQEPVPITFENATCVLHFELPSQRAYTQKKYESDEGSGADDDDEVIAITSAPPTTTNASTTSTAAAAAGGGTSETTTTTRKAADAADAQGGFATTLSSIEQSADAMSPLCMDLDSDTEAASSNGG